MKIEETLLQNQYVIKFKENWFYNHISKLINNINQQKNQLSNDDLREHNIKVTDSSYILQQYQSQMNSTNMFQKIKNNLFKNSILIFLYQFIDVLCQLSNLLLLDLFTDQLKSNNKIYILYLFLILFLSFFKTYIGAFTTQQCLIFLGKVDVILNYELYKKLLIVNNTQKNDECPNIITLVTNDIEQIKALHSTIKEGTTALGMIIGCLCILYYKDVHAGNIIIIVIICAQIFNIFVTFMMMKAQEKMFQRKDKRISLTQDILHGIKQIKYLSWEQIFKNKIMDKRKFEYQMLIVAKIFDGILVLFWNNVNYILLYFYIQNSNQNLIDLNVFTLIAIFNSMIYPLGILPFSINFLLSALVSISRIEKYYNQQIVEKKYEQEQNECEYAIQLKNSNYQLSNEFTLQINNFEIKKKSLNFIIGPIGSGKTTLYNAILNELNNNNESNLNINGSISFCSQNTWIQNQTIKQNILFGKEYEQQWFNTVLKLCQLKDDIIKFKNQEEYLVGPEGNNLSGGQKQRIAIARAIYQNSDIYLFDDSFSSLDIPVADQIFKDLILNHLQYKTVLFITSNKHTISQIPNNANIYYLENGQIIQSQITEQNIQIKKLSSQINDSEDQQSESQQTQEQNKQQDIEEREEGQVDLKVWKYFFYSMGLPFLFFYLLFNYSMQGVLSFIDFWLKSSPFDNNFSSTFTKLLLLALLVTLFRALFYVLASLRSAWTIFKKLNDQILNAKMIFFDNTNIGRIINRYSSDTETIDGLLPWSLDIFFEASARGSGYIIGLIILFPFISIFLIGIFYIYYYIASTYIKTNRELKRLKQANHSELLGWINETQKGSKTIRAFNKTNYFFDQFLFKLNIWNISEQSGLRAKFWYFVRLNLTCNFLLLIASILLLFSNNNYESKALALTYSILIINNFNDLFNFYLQAEQMIISVERVEQYSQNPLENINKKITNRKIIIFDETQQPINQQNEELNQYIIQIKDYMIKQIIKLKILIYLQNKMKKLQSTGSGKTSIMNILFQLYEHQSGNLIINGENVKYLSLNEIRNYMSIVPQFGFLFEGTIKENLDPTNTIDSQQIDSLLKEFCQLKSDYLIQAGGNNLSNGEKQLINYIRIVLQNKQIICLDEATSNIDPKTDKMLHEYLFKFIKNKTLIVITHRMDQIEQYDRVIYLDKGQIVKILDKQNI